MIEILLVVMVFALLINVPIAVSLGFGGLMALHFGSNVSLVLVAQRMFTAVDSTTLLAIPLFIFAGKILSEGGISKRLVNAAHASVGWLPGSLGMVSVLACMFFAALTGSGPATVAAIGSIMLPAMIEDGYPVGFSAALICSASIMGVILPPSIPYVNYATIAGVSIGDQFMAGVVPGLMIGLFLMFFCYFAAKRRGFGQTTQKFDFKEFIIAFKNAFWGLLMPLIILGGIYGGIFTPTEAAAVACVYGLIVGYFIYRGFKLRQLINFSYESAKTTGMIFFIVAAASIFSWILATEQVPAMIASAVLGLTDNTILILLLINILLLLSGTFMEMTASTFIYTPILMPIIHQLGIHPVHFGVIMVLNMAIGFITPPTGIHIFVACGLDKRVTFNGVLREVFPMFVVLIVLLMLVTYIEPLSMGLIRLLG